jgi:hypothetical protein
VELTSSPAGTDGSARPCAGPPPCGAVASASRSRSAGGAQVGPSSPRMPVGAHGPSNHRQAGLKIFLSPSK